MLTLQIIKYFRDFPFNVGGCGNFTPLRVFVMHVKCICACIGEHLCGRELVLRRPWSGLQCVELHGRVSGEGLVCAL